MNRLHTNGFSIDHRRDRNAIACFESNFERIVRPVRHGDMNRTRMCKTRMIRFDRNGGGPDALIGIHPFRIDDCGASVVVASNRSGVHGRPIVLSIRPSGVPLGSTKCPWPDRHATDRAAQRIYHPNVQ